MTIKEAAEKFNITPDTIRYYEKIGLLSPVPRTASKIRDFDELSLRRLEFITCMRSAGVSIEGLSEYMRLLSVGKSTVSARKKLLEKERESLLKNANKLTPLLINSTIKSLCTTKSSAVNAKIFPKEINFTKLKAAL